MSARADRLAMIEAGPDPDAPEEHVGEPSKISIRLAAPPYYGLLKFSAEAAKIRGKRVTNVEVFRALVELLLEDEDVRGKIIARLRGRK